MYVMYIYMAAWADQYYKPSMINDDAEHISHTNYYLSKHINSFHFIKPKWRFRKFL